MRKVLLALSVAIGFAACTDNGGCRGCDDDDDDLEVEVDHDKGVDLDK